MTAYYFECTEQFYENLEILLDYVYTPYFTDENVQKEQGIIGQEIGMIEDDPATRGYFSLLQGLYQTHPIRTSIAGSVESISRITKETLYTCHRAFYSPANMALCVCGDVDAERVLDMARRLSPKDSLHIAGRFYGDEPQRVYQPRQEQEMEISLPLALMGWKDDPARFGDDPVFYRNVAEIAAACLCGPSSPLYHRLFEQGLITRDFTCEYLFFPGGGCLVLGGESRDPDETFRQVRQQVEEYAKNGMDEALFTRVMRFAYGMCVRVLDGLDETLPGAGGGCLRRQQLPGSAGDVPAHAGGRCLAFLLPFRRRGARRPVHHLAQGPYGRVGVRHDSRNRLSRSGADLHPGPGGLHHRQ